MCISPRRAVVDAIASLPAAVFDVVYSAERAVVSRAGDRGPRGRVQVRTGPCQKYEAVLLSYVNYRTPATDTGQGRLRVH